jgi:tetratricopeptide (TPR) repeat protein
VVADRHFQKRDLGRCVAIYRRVGAAVPGDVDIANNEGLFCRDHADALGGRRGQLTDELRDLYEASYAAYTRASQLDPSNVRLRNDRALILVYSLRRELELAEEILDSAVRDGQRQLDENPPEDSGDLRNLQEAVGDAHGNLAVLYFQQERFADARKAAAKSLEYYPFQRRAGAGLLRQIDAAEKKKQEEKDGKNDKDGE